MKITKFGHSCVLVEERGVRILFDPGNFSDIQNTVDRLDAIIITHKHGDHLSIESLRTIKQNNKNALIITNKDVEEQIQKENYMVRVVEDGQSFLIKDLNIEAFGKDHKSIYENVPTPVCTGYLVDGKLFHPGDNFTNPGKPVEILLFPITAPMIKVSEALDYVKEIKPKVAIPIHDGNLKDPLFIDSLLSSMITNQGVQFLRPELGKEYDL